MINNLHILDIQKELENRMYTISQTSFCIQQKLRGRYILSYISISAI